MPRVYCLDASKSQDCLRGGRLWRAVLKKDLAANKEREPRKRRDRVRQDYCRCPGSSARSGRSRRAIFNGTPARSSLKDDRKGQHILRLRSISICGWGPVDSVRDIKPPARTCSSPRCSTKPSTNTIPDPPARAGAQSKNSSPWTRYVRVYSYGHHPEISAPGAIASSRRRCETYERRGAVRETGF